MHWAIRFSLVLLALGLVAGIATAGGADSPDVRTEALYQIDEDPPDLGLSECAADVPENFEDPSGDAMGWYDGLWYSESIDVNTTDGLSDQELDLVIARSIARLEALRCLPFEEDIDVDVIDRATYQEEHAGFNLSAEQRHFENAQGGALFLVGQDEDAIEVQEANRGATVGGFYSPSDEQIVLVTDAEGELHIDESTLAHELGHALQDQHFELGNFGGNTTDENMANLGLIEGEVSFIDTVYSGHCEGGAWAGECVSPPNETSSPDLANVGYYLISIQPYSDGPNFVASVYESGGWEAVNELHDAYPDSAKEVMYPDLYPEFSPAHPPLENQSTDDWRLLESTREVNFDHLGEATLFSALAATDLDSFGAGVVDTTSLFNERADGTLEPLNPYNFSHESTDGWIGDRFIAFADAHTDLDDDPALAYQLDVAFDDPSEAAAFNDTWVELLLFHDASPVAEMHGEQSAVYEINETEGFDGAYWIEQDGEQVTVVKAPTVDDLMGVNTEIADAVATPTPTPSQTSDGIPGFGMTVAVLGLLSGLAILVARRR